MLVIGLTGGIATGKSTVSNELSIQGIPVIDADVISREVVEPGKSAYKLVVDAFGPEVPDLLEADGAINRPALGRAVFGNNERLRTLNGIVHGAVKREMLKQLLWSYVSGVDMVVLDVPLLFEAGLHRICGATITVSTDEDTQLKRLLERNPDLSEEDAKKRILSQLSMQERNAKADTVIDNNGLLQELHHSVQRVVDLLRPSRVWTMLTWFPPFGFLVAIFTVVTRTMKDAKGPQESKNLKSD